MSRECEVNRDEQQVAGPFALEPEEPDGGRDIYLEYQQTPPFSQVPISQSGEQEVEKARGEGTSAGSHI